MRDRDIRQALRIELRRLHEGEPNTLVLDELGLCQGNVRVDLAVINGSLNGFEIKSEKDTLGRLPGQQEIYSKTLDSVTIVASRHHLEKIIEMVPDWWGIQEAALNGDNIYFYNIRNATTNPNVDPFCLAQLLWRDEVLLLLAELRLDKGIKSKPRRVLWRRLIDNVTLNELNELVRRQLKARANWRSALSPKLDDDLCQPSSMY